MSGRWKEELIPGKDPNPFPFIAARQSISSFGGSALGQKGGFLSTAGQLPGAQFRVQMEKEQKKQIYIYMRMGIRINRGAGGISRCMKE